MVPLSTSPVFVTFDIEELARRSSPKLKNPAIASARWTLADNDRAIELAVTALDGRHKVFRVSYNQPSDNLELLRATSGGYHDFVDTLVRRVCTQVNAWLAPRPSPAVESPKALSTQVGGGHYKDMAIQPVEFIHANQLDYLAGNVVKYVCRHRTKNGAQDLLKARHYLDLLLELEYGLSPSSPAATEPSPAGPLPEEPAFHSSDAWDPRAVA